MITSFIIHYLLWQAAMDFGTNCPTMMISRRVNSLAIFWLRGDRGSFGGSCK